LHNEIDGSSEEESDSDTDSGSTDDDKDDKPSKDLPVTKTQPNGKSDMSGTKKQQQNRKSTETPKGSSQAAKGSSLTKKNDNSDMDAIVQLCIICRQPKGVTDSVIRLPCGHSLRSFGTPDLLDQMGRSRR
jgi:hypothetical protein